MPRLSRALFKQSGLPKTALPEATDLVTTLLVPMVALSPMDTPGRMIVPTIDPDASADRDRVGNLETLGTQGPVFGVFSAPELDCGALQCSAADLCKILRT